MYTTQQFLALAREETGLVDFGSDSFREGLEILLESLHGEAQLNAMGEHVLQEQILRHLKQRLQVEDWHRRYPEIDEEVIAKPLIGLSLPRTGSTALSFLLARDPNSRYLQRWEASEPCPPPSTVQGSDPRIEQDREAQQKNAAGQHTPSGSAAPAECLDLMSLDFKSQMFQAFAQIPSYSRWLLDADLSSTYLYERRVLKLLQWGCPEKPWRLKCPSHLIYMEYLDEAFPDARFVMTHRDPSDVMLSVIDVYCDIARRFSDHVDMHYMADLNIRQWSVGMQRALAFRRSGDNDSRFYDIHFTDMHADPVAAVRGLYEWLDEPVCAEFEQGMHDWWRLNSANRDGPVSRSATDYGVDLDRVRTLFADYTEAMKEWTERGRDDAY